MAELSLQALTPDLFRPFGHVVATGAGAPVAANAGTAWRHDVAAFAGDVRPGSRLVVSLFETAPQALPAAVTLLERHPHSLQMIVALEVSHALLAVCGSGADGAPDLSTLRAFHCRPGEGVIYAPGVWHAPLIGIGGPGRFLVQSWQDGTAADCEEIAIPPWAVRAPAGEAAR
nr:ureidoglycolate lyase [Ancylobacter koreensis]